MKKYEFFKVEGDKINRVRRHCPKCGPAVFLAEHKDRFSCGKCGYTEFEGGSRKQSEPKPEKVEEKPVEESKLEEVEPEQSSADEKTEEAEDKKEDASEKSNEASD